MHNTVGRENAYRCVNVTLQLLKSCCVFVIKFCIHNEVRSSHNVEYVHRFVLNYTSLDNFIVLPLSLFSFLSFSFSPFFFFLTYTCHINIHVTSRIRAYLLYHMWKSCGSIIRLDYNIKNLLWLEKKNAHSGLHALCLRMRTIPILFSFFISHFFFFSCVFFSFSFSFF